MFGYCSRIAGDQSIELTHAIDTDPELVADLNAYLDDASLKVSVWSGRAWEAQGAFRPEANAVTFTRGLRIRVPGGAGDTVRVRLRSMADVWRIDAISADWTPAAPLPMRPVDLLSAIGPGGTDMRPLLRSDDDRYAILLPPDRVEMTFAGAGAEPGARTLMPGKTAPNSRTVYVVAGRGYLHEWIPAQAGDGESGIGRSDEAAASLAAMVPEDQRIDFLKELLKHREIVLQTVYQEWRRAPE
jgi:hypothetical protein